MIQQSQGFIADRTRENLTATDAAIVKFRRTVMEGARRLSEDGEEPEGPAGMMHTRPAPAAGLLVRARPSKMCCSNGSGTIADWCCEEGEAMLTAEENAILTETDADTPMGEYFRRYWQPIALSEELPELDSDPLRVTVMGEELVAFRDTNGRVGLMDRRCPHRGADMFFGRNEECGLRCVYHGTNSMSTEMRLICRTSGRAPPPDYAH